MQVRMTSFVVLSFMVCLLSLLGCQPSSADNQNKEDLHLTISAGSQAILVSWRVTLSHVTVTWQDEFDGSGEMVLKDASEVMITNVRPCTTVNVAVYTDGADSQPARQPARQPAAVATTDTSGRAPPAVQNMETSNITARSLSLSWERPDTACEITDYTITYVGTAKWGLRTQHAGSATIDRLIANSVTSVDVDGLMPYTEYTVTVAAVTKAGVGISVNTIVVTQEEEPSEPHDLQSSSLSSSAIFLTWKAPNEANGILSGYTVRWLGNDRKLDEANTTYPVHTIVDLAPCVEWTVQVAAHTAAGEGKYQEIRHTTPPAVSIQNAFCIIDRDTQELTMTWFKPDSACLITGYELSFKNDPDQCFASINAFTPGSSLSYTTTLAPEDETVMCVAAMLEEGRGQRTCCVEIIPPAKTGWCWTLIAALAAILAACFSSILLPHHGTLFGCKKTLYVLVEYQGDDSEAISRYSSNKLSK